MPRDPSRIGRILVLLQVYWTMNPDLRLAQIIGNATDVSDPYYFEDDELEAWLDRKLRDASTPDGSKANP